MPHWKPRSGVSHCGEPDRLGRLASRQVSESLGTYAYATTKEPAITSISPTAMTRRARLVRACRSSWGWSAGFWPVESARESRLGTSLVGTAVYRERSLVK